MKIPLYLTSAFVFVLGAALAFVLTFPLLAGTEEVRAPSTTPSVHQAHLLFVGDMMFDRQIRQVGEANGFEYLFSCADATLSKYDAVVGNLEGPITTSTSTSMGSVVDTPENYTFTFPPEIAPLLKRHNVRIVNLGNNHTLNFSRAGLLQTKQFLTDAGVLYFGDPDSLESEKVGRFEIGGVKLSFVNWSDWTSDNTDHAAHQIQDEVAAGRVVVVYTHWGEEYVPPTEKVKTLAHQFVDMGASIVIGSHPHIVQEHELYKGKYIYYSLGNFIFDQYFSDAVSHGLTLDVTLDAKGVVNIQELPVELLRDGRTCFTAQ